MAKKKMGFVNVSILSYLCLMGSSFLGKVSVAVVVAVAVAVTVVEGVPSPPKLSSSFAAKTSLRILTIKKKEYEQLKLD